LKEAEMSTTTGADAIDTSMQAASPSISSTRVVYLDNLRYLMVVLVVIYHAVAAYALVAPHWVIHDTHTLAADIIRELFDVFMMPVLFFVAGYFALVSLEKKGTWEFLRDKVKRLLVPWALAVFIVAPLALYDQPIKPVQPFRNYWWWYLGQYAVRLRPSEAPVGATTQMIYRFISLLFAFFLVLALVNPLLRKWRGADVRPVDGDLRRSQLPARPQRGPFERARNAGVRVGARLW
jgi:peptidoglycan/LPS O-acetylase OafA/YrhL